MNAQLVTLSTGTPLSPESRFFLAEELAMLGVALRQDPLRFDGSAAALTRLIGSCGLTVWLCDHAGMAAACETAAQCFGVASQRHTPSSERAAEFVRNTGEQTATEVRLPQGCTVFANEHGPYPGFSLTRQEHTLMVLPTAEGELVPLFTTAVLPVLASLTGRPIASHTVGIFGLTEAAVRRRLADVLTAANPLITLRMHSGECLLRITARGADTAAAQALCDRVTQTVCTRLESAVYGVDAGSLQKKVATLLAEKNCQIATAESCTAGLLSGMLTEVPGTSAVFQCGVAAYSNEIKQTVLHVPQELLDTYGAVSPQTAGAMAEGVRAISGATLGIGITGVAGPDVSEGKPVGTVYMALADEKRTWVKQVSGYESLDRETIRRLAAASALDLTRRYLEALPAVMAGGELRREPAPAAVIPSAEAEGAVPVTPGKRPHRVRRALLWLMTPVVLVAAAAAAYLRWWAPLTNRWDIDRIQQLYSVGAGTAGADASAYPAGMLPQFYSLYRSNSDVRGWLHISGTPLDYPVMESGTTDYGQNNFFKQPSEYGVPYFGKGSDFSAEKPVSRCLTVCGNNCGEQMFGPLTAYFNTDTLLRSPTVSLDTLYSARQYTVFAVAITTGDTADPDYFDYTRTDFADNKAFFAFVQALRERAVLYNHIKVTKTDDLLLLCADVEEELGVPNARMLVCARTAHGDEDADRCGTVTENRTVAVPKSWLTPLGSSPVSFASRCRFVAATLPDIPEESPAYEDDTYQPESESLDELPDDPEAVPADASTAVSGSVTTAVSTAASAASTAGSAAGSTASAPGTGTTAGTTAASTAITAASVTTTGRTTAKTTGSTTAKPTAGTTVQPISGGNLRNARYAENEYLPLFQLQNTATGAVYTASSASEVQLGLFYVVKKELGSARSMLVSTEAQKAQAVASYTYVLKYNATRKAPYALSFPSFNPAVSTDKKLYDAIGEVLGVKLLDVTKTALKDQLCEAMYFSSSCGVTATNSKVYSASLPYLVSVSSPYDTAAIAQKYFPGYAFTAKTTVSFASLRSKVAAYLGIAEKDLKAESAGDTPLYARSYDGGKGRYVAETNLYYMKKGVKTYVTGATVRKALGSNVLRSHAFTVTYNKDTDDLTLHTTGWGHGVGLSQVGAVGYANEKGWTYDRILRHYYSITDSSACQLVAPDWTHQLS